MLEIKRNGNFSSKPIEKREENDFYATEPKAIDLLLKNHEIKTNGILEPCCGKGHLSERLKHFGYNVTSSDLINRNYGTVKNVFDYNEKDLFEYNTILTNPPYDKAQEIVEHLYKNSLEKTEIIMFLKIQFLESEKRQTFFEHFNPKNIYVFSKRIKCAKNGEFEKYKSSTTCYAWFIWEVGYKGKTTIERI